jgi:hypothetical protein
MTLTQRVPQYKEQTVLVCQEETCEDKRYTSVEHSNHKEYVAMQPCSSEQYDIVELYSTDDDETRHNCQPFLQYVSLKGKQGEAIQVKALFDEGAMVNAMCATAFEQAKSQLRGWGTSLKRLCMANGAVIPSKASWKGEVTIGGIKTEGEFEVFESGGGWEFLLGKPLLQAFRAIHEYETDVVHITGEGGSTIIYNQNQWRDKMKEEKHSLTREVQPQNHNAHSEIRTDQNPSLETSTSVHVISNDEVAVFTRMTNPANPKRVAYIVKAVQYGEALNEEERKQVEDLVAKYSDIFACSLAEVLPVPGAQHQLNIPENATFNLRIQQRALTPPQAQFLHGKIDEMLAAGIIEKAPAEKVKCCTTTVLAQKAHEQGGLTLEELQHRVNEQYAQHGQPPAFMLPERELQEAPLVAQENKPQKWRICQNFNEVNRHTIIAPMPQGDIRAKQLRLSGHKYVSVFDFASGFYAVKVPEESRPYTAFYVEG